LFLKAFALNYDRCPFKKEPVVYRSKTGNKSFFSKPFITFKNFSSIGYVLAFGLNAEVMLYPSGKNLQGFYFAPNISYSSLTDTEIDETISLFSIGGLIGWQWFPGDQFAIGLGTGLIIIFYPTIIPATTILKNTSEWRRL